MLVFSLLLLLPVTRAQSPDSLLVSLQNAGLTSLASALATASQSPEGQNIVNHLLTTNQSYTIFAPDNTAFTNPSLSQVTTNPALLANILSYHVLPGKFYDSNNALIVAVSPSTTVGRTLLTSTSSLSNLEAGKGQVVVWTRSSSDSPIYFLNQNPQITIFNYTTLSNLFIVQINGVLSPPKDLASTLSDNTLNLNSLAGIASMVTLPSFYSNGTSATLAQALSADQTKGYTLFAPDNDALARTTDVLAGLANNSSALLALLGNHVINGSSYYSPTLLSSNTPSNAFVSSSGQPFSLTTNSSGAYVISSNKASAKIIKSDVLVSNGVIHVVDRVLVNTDVDEGKAREAYANAVKAASATETGPVGALMTPSSTSSAGGTTGTSGSGGGVKSSDASALEVGVGAVALGVLLGALRVLGGL